MKIVKLLGIVSFCLIYSPSLMGQEKWVENYKLATWFGFRDVNIDRITTTENIDFMNYLLQNPDLAEYDYLGFSAHIWLKGSWEADIKIAMYDDFLPANLNLKAQYFFLKNIGITAGFYSYSQLLNNFSDYHRENDDMFYGDLNKNFRQRSIYDIGMMVGIALKADYRFIHGRFNINGGLNSTSPFSEEVKQKQINSNFRREIQYKTKHTPTLFFFPELELNMDCLKIKEANAGIQFQANWYKADRAIDYERVMKEWTGKKPVKERISSPKHVFKKFEINFGIYLRW